MRKAISAWMTAMWCLVDPRSNSRAIYSRHWIDWTSCPCVSCRLVPVNAPRVTPAGREAASAATTASAAEARRERALEHQRAVQRRLDERAAAGKAVGGVQTM